MLCPNDRPNLSGFFNVEIFVGDLSLSGKYKIARYKWLVISEFYG